jgi:hypothetical protein
MAGTLHTPPRSFAGPLEPPAEELLLGIRYPVAKCDRPPIAKPRYSQRRGETRCHPRLLNWSCSYMTNVIYNCVEVRNGCVV